MLNCLNHSKRIISRTNTVLFAFHANAISTPARAGQHMFLALDRPVFAHNLRKELQLRAAKSLAGSRRRTNRATLPGAQQTALWLFAIFAIAPLLAAGLIRQQPRSIGEAS